jgi:hypothetical protein
MSDKMFISQSAARDGEALEDVPKISTSVTPRRNIVENN